MSIFDKIKSLFQPTVKEELPLPVEIKEEPRVEAPVETPPELPVVDLDSVRVKEEPVPVTEPIVEVKPVKEKAPKAPKAKAVKEKPTEPAPVNMPTSKPKTRTKKTT